MIMSKFYRRLSGNSSMISRVVLGIALFIVHCAHQVPPSGGEPDTTPPSIKTTSPASGSVSHAPTKAITLTFNEWIEPKSAEKSITLFPPLDDGITVKVRGKNLQIVPENTFAESTTYHIELNNTLKDLHGNSLGTPFHFVFSTGASLDSGRITGCVIDPRKKILQPKVALIRWNSDTIADSMLFEKPSYLTQTDSTGNFVFDHISEGPYVLLAYLDQNNDNRLQPGKEQAYASSERKIKIGTRPLLVMLFPAVSDTAAIRVKSLSPISEMYLIGTFSDSSALYNKKLFSKWTISAYDKSDMGLTIDTILLLHHSNRFVLQLENPMEQTGYDLIYPQTQLLHTPDNDSLRFDTLRFNGFAAEDTMAPKVTFFAPRSPADLNPRIVIAGSEPIRCDSVEWFITDTTGDTILVRCDSGYGDTVVFIPQRSLGCSRDYSFSIPWEFFVDLVGNKASFPHDTLENLKGTFSTIDCDNLCISLSGQGKCLHHNPDRWWVFTSFSSKKSYYAKDENGGFAFDSLLAGDGSFAFFEDLNSDSLPNRGRLTPWSAPEPYIPFYDTVEARARWDIEGIEVPACDLCKRFEVPTQGE
ncbi:MAG: hypothetical protein GF401_14540 [Chitinivibrionales bacterium]|nr:hypothetical protein [Chitinivibrionales bacterium]